MLGAQRVALLPMETGSWTTTWLDQQTNLAITVKPVLNGHARATS